LRAGVNKAPNVKLKCDAAAGWGQHTLQLQVTKQVARGAEILLSYGEEYGLPQLPPPVFAAKVPRRKKTQKKTPEADDGVKAKKEEEAEAEGIGEEVD